MEELGTGVLDWRSEERISDRYGTVILFDQPKPDRKPIALRRVGSGRLGQLIAVVRESRASPHVGDWFHGVYPSRPTVGEEVVLGNGWLFFFDDGVGLLPQQRRRTLWLDIHALYRVHHQTVTLFFNDRP